MPHPVPYGAWPSPLSAAAVARGGVSLGAVFATAAGRWWSEGRASESGRVAVVRDGVDLLPPPWNARTQVHEYGGGAWLPLGDGLLFVHWDDQRVHVVEAPGAEPVAITPADGRRYADFALTADGTRVVCVRETHAATGVSHDLVSLALDGSGDAEVLWDGSDFVAAPAIAADGRLAFVTWDHPGMPWDGSEIRVLDGGEVTVVDGRKGLSTMQPQWAPDGSLLFISERTGWWNLHRWDGTEVAPVWEVAEEVGDPAWAFGFAAYRVLDDGRIAVVHGTHTRSLGVLDPATGAVADLDLPFTAFGVHLSVHGSTAVCVAAGPVDPAAAVAIDLTSGAVEVLRSSTDEPPDPAYVSRPYSVTVPSAGGRVAHAHVFPPANADVQPPDGELPPYIIDVHGGPTAQSEAVYDDEFAFFTSRGIGVVSVNYGGSTGYGRDYRSALDGQWGVVDVEDCAAVAQWLGAEGIADPARVAIRGGSAGGWTVLAALTRTDAFGAGISYFGVADLESFVAETHDFESTYIDGLVGPLPEAAELYRERSPLSSVDGVSCPVLLLQGLEDAVVPPSQAEVFLEALRRRGLPHAYLAFEGEQHGFRRAESIIAALEGELSFLGQVFGFDPPGVDRLPLVTS